MVTSHIVNEISAGNASLDLFITSMTAFYIILIAVNAIAIPLFVKGMIRITRGCNQLMASGIDISEIYRKRPAMITFFVLAIVFPYGMMIGFFATVGCAIAAAVCGVLSILFLILMIARRKKIYRMMDAAGSNAVNYPVIS